MKLPSFCIKTIATILTCLVAAGILLFGCGVQHKDNKRHDLPQFQRATNTPGNKADIKIAVGGIRDHTKYNKLAMGPFVEHRLESALSYEKGLSLCTRNTMDEIKKEHQLVFSGMVDRKDAIKIGKLLNVDYFVFTEINQIEIKKNMLVEVPKFLLGFVAYRATLQNDRVGRAVSDTSAHVQTRLVLTFTLMGIDGKDYLVKKYQADFSRVVFDFRGRTRQANQEKISQAISRIIDTYTTDLSTFLLR